MRTHVVANVVPAPRGLHVLRSDAALTEAVGRWVTSQDPGGAAELDTLGELAGTPEVRTWADQADRYTPVLRTHDATGERTDEVEYHPSYHRLLQVAVGGGLTAYPRTRPPDTGAHARRAAGFLIWSQVGRIRRAGQHHPGRAHPRRAARGRHLPAHGAQVVLLGTDE